MKCATDVVSCLREINIEPICIISGTVGQIHKPSNGIDYDLSYDYYVHSNAPDIKNWWQIDFQKTVYINKYKLISLATCNYVKEWLINVSTNGIDWETVDQKNNGFSDNSTISLDNIAVARYVRVVGSSPNCETPGILAFKRIYFYGAISASIRTCRHGISFHFTPTIIFCLVVIIK